MTDAPPLLEVRGLTTVLSSPRGRAAVVDHVDLSLGAGQTLTLVGESGSGKTMLALSLLRLVPNPPATIEAGSVRFRGEELLALPESDMERVRGAGMAMVFQEPASAVNPVLSIGEQVSEGPRLTLGLSRTKARDRARELLGSVGIADPDACLRSYAHELSGGMLQRAAIAMALALRPALLLADEPTSSLDATIRARILDLLLRLQKQQGASILCITHDLAVAAAFGGAVLVMYAGRIVEEGDAASLLRTPLHPYSQGLLGSLPVRGPRASGARLAAIAGAPPDPFSLPRGCAFHPRCPQVLARCRTEAPPFFSGQGGRKARCWLLAVGRAENARKARN